jgi:probable rRNA maturation factor
VLKIKLGKSSLLPRHRVKFCDRTGGFTEYSFIRAAKKGVLSALAYLNVKPVCEVELCFAGEEEIRNLNRRFRNNDNITDVLSFPSLEIKKGQNPKEAAGKYDYIDGRIFLGSIVICKPVALKQAESFGHSPEREFAFLSVHSLLHLLGYDHEQSKADENEMFSLQEKILLSAGLVRT